ncbi:MAG: tRNA (N(6)-L-threonylcarbamoyladenosine(37)-C(2))-methylthiotransferase MtaB [Syntrophomonadaceae bacterium]|jgi:threonylcarbamoyladenosine tRNA methylthiotransferase MtaB|nr:tRNA (N(6)-L-threonylcarbamoyladenosine(37)-C(2))-methylthiotransferase MtaB [Syntrophomonadaceae bacterium]
MRVAFRTLGCKVNQVESEQLKEEFIRQGYEIVDYDREADIYIINTCTVTHTSDRKSRSAIRRAIRQQPGAVTVAIGCLAQVNPEQLEAIEGINLVVGNDQKENLPSIIRDYMATQPMTAEVYRGSFARDSGLKTVNYSRPHKRTRGFIKIQDGCENHCSYCIVPQARGPVRSKKPLQVLEEIERMLELGYREVVLTGIHTGLYAYDITDWDLSRLIQEIFEQIKGEYRIRLSSIEPLEVSRPLLDIMASESRLCRHLHIPLQSGSDRILKAMNRRYDRSYYRELLQRVQEQIPGIALTTDIMVGFPGEREGDFQQSLDLLKQLPVYDLHVFPYSLRRGTVAAEMDEQVDEAEKHRRSKILIELGKELKQRFINKLQGQTMQVLIEKKIGPHLYQGLSDNYVPVQVHSAKDITGQFITTTLRVDGIPLRVDNKS